MKHNVTRYLLTDNSVNTKASRACWHTLGLLGFKASGIHVVSKPSLFGGETLAIHDGEAWVFQKMVNLTTTMRLFIGQGGLKNKNISKEDKMLFKSKVSPLLAASCSVETRSFTGEICLHFCCGELKHADLHLN